MEYNVKSTAGIRQFEQTAVNKLVAEGVPQHVAYAFVHIGLPKAGNTQRVKDHVCKMKYEKFLIEKTEADFKDPFRVGRMVPHVVDSKMHKFHTEFAMNDIDAARFSKSFPEFEIISRGRSHNQHSFYANKRYAECELLVTMVYKDAASSGLNPRSLIDLGGNDTWHTKRGRDYVHCDNPVLSYRDIMRYKSREIFSSSDTRLVCKKKFGDCDFKADYAIAVHSTYDISPKQIAFDMHKKNVSRFFGVINYIPGVENKPQGTYIADGMIMKVVRPTRDLPYVMCSFVNDPSLEYKHSLVTLKQYLYVNKRYEVAAADGTISVYTYRIVSVRGNSLIFSLVKENIGLFKNDYMWSPPTRKLYYISMKFLGIKSMEVESELFDRLVLQAAGARNVDDYDIVSLYRYAKSLRQRVSINNIVLSSGYVMNSEDLVHVVIAAFSTAAAYRAESSVYFKKATQQIINMRGRGFLRNVMRIGGTLFLRALLALPAALGKTLRLDVLNDRLKAAVAANGSVEIELDKPHVNRGIMFSRDMLSSKRRLVSIKEVIRAGGDLHDLSDRYSANKPSGLHVDCEGSQVCFLTRGVVKYDVREMPEPTPAPKFIDFSTFYNSLSSKSVEDARNLLYAEASKFLLGATIVDTQTFVMSNADRLVRKLPFDRFALARQAFESRSFSTPGTFVVYRGVGSKAVVLSPPPQYAARGCARFVLFYDRAVSYEAHSEILGNKGIRVETYAVNDSASDISRFSTISANTADSHANDLIVVKNAPAEFVNDKLESGEYFMSGGLGSTLDTPPADTSDYTSFISDRHPQLPTVLESPNFVDDSSEFEFRGDAESIHSEGSSAVDSSDLVPGKESMLEFVDSCSESEKVAVASGRALMELAITVSRGETPFGRFAGVAQGHPGKPIVVKVVGTDWTNFDTGNKVPHMAVTDGAVVFDRVIMPPHDGIYITSDVMRVYTGAAIKRSVESVLNDPFRCDVVCVDGPAGAGKTYTITHTAKPGDVVLCETSGALKSTARDLYSNIKGWTGHAYTADSFLMHRPVRECNTLFLDEAYRLHAGKVFAIIKMLKPSKVICYGDEKQIPVLSYIPGFDFIYHKFPFTRVERKFLTYRLPADICFALTGLGYYDYHTRTKNPIMRSVKESKQYDSNMFLVKPDHVALLVYTQTVKEDLVHQGVKFVMTIGEAQGETFDHVIVYRHTSLPIALFYDAEQALVAVSRSRRTFQYVTADNLMRDNSRIADIVRYAREKASEVLLSSHLEEGVVGVADAHTFEARRSARRAPSALSVNTIESVGDIEYVVDDMRDLYFGS